MLYELHLLGRKKDRKGGMGERKDGRKRKEGRKNRGKKGERGKGKKQENETAPPPHSVIRLMSSRDVSEWVWGGGDFKDHFW